MPRELREAGGAVRQSSSPPNGAARIGRSGAPYSRIVSAPPGLRSGYDAVCRSLAGKMMLSEEADETAPDSAIPAGLTYFGQFIAHDVSFLLDGDGAGDALNARALPLALESLYGGGNRLSPHLYSGAGGIRFALGGRNSLLASPTVEAKPAPWRARLVRREFDLLRRDDGVAIIADARNDEHVILSQMHLALELAHNALVDEATSRAPKNAAPDVVFATARRELTRRYHYAILHDFLPAILCAEVRAALEDALPRIRPWSQSQDRLVLPAERPAIPLEFVLAAFRFGHSMVRPAYALNDLVVRPIELTQKYRGQDPTRFLSGNRQLPAGWTIDWRFFLPSSGPRGELVPARQRARAIDTRITSQLGSIPGPDGAKSLAFHTLRRGFLHGLASGPAVAGALAARFRTEPFRSNVEDSPLWYYVLEESAAREGGERLGSTGSRIIQEVLLSLVAAHPDCYLGGAELWQPPAGAGGRPYGVFDLLQTGWAEAERLRAGAA